MPDPREVARTMGEEPANGDDDSIGQGCGNDPGPEDGW